MSRTWNPSTGESYPESWWKRSHHDRSQPALCTVDECCGRFCPSIELQCDFVHQYNTVFNKHTDKSQGTYDGNKVEGLSSYEHDRYDTD